MINLSRKNLFYGGLILVIIIFYFIGSNNKTVTQQDSGDNKVVVDMKSSISSTSVLADKDLSVGKKLIEISTSTIKILDNNIGGTYYAVDSVVDGDTIKININGTVKTLRLIGIDTPETVDPRKAVQCFGKEASNKAKELLIGKKVCIEQDLTQGEFDKYGRTLVYVYREDGLFFNKYMIEQGYAYEYTYNTPYKFQADFKELQRIAQKDKRGLWSPDTCGGLATPVLIKTEVSTTSVSIKTNISNNQSNTVYYTSSYGTSKYYYPASCSGWKSLSAKYLKTFNSLEELLKVYPSKILSPQF